MRTKKTKVEKPSRLCNQTCIEPFIGPLTHIIKHGWVQGGEPITLEMIQYLLDIGAGNIQQAFGEHSMKEPEDEDLGLIFATLINTRDNKGK